MSKYHSIRVEQDGYVFDSKAEAARYSELKLLERACAIERLEVHPKFPLDVNGERVGTYIGDFRYTKLPEHQVVVEDVKGVRTAVYRLKKKLMKAIHGIGIAEVGSDTGRSFTYAQASSERFHVVKEKKHVS